MALHRSPALSRSCGTDYELIQLKPRYLALVELDACAMRQEFGQAVEHEWHGTLNGAGTHADRRNDQALGQDLAHVGIPELVAPLFVVSGTYDIVISTSLRSSERLCLFLACARSSPLPFSPSLSQTPLLKSLPSGGPS